MDLAVDSAPFMIQCAHCGQSNSDESQYCRFCGQRMPVRRPENYDFSPPRPYSWKTDEYQTRSEARAPQAPPKLEQRQQPAPFYPGQAGPLDRVGYHGPQDMTGNYRCPFCGTHYLPQIERRISTAGWITFGLLLVFTVVFFWIGLLLKEEVAICPVCRRQVS